MSDRKIAGVEACSNHGCVFGHPGGMGTNGQCHCLDIRPPDARIRATRNVLALRAALTAERERADRAEAELKCGHPASLMLHSAETGEPLYCELCDMRSQRNDAVQMEEHYKAERDALRERVARLVGAIEPVAKVHINRAGGNVGIAWHAIGIDGSLPALADGEVLYVLRTALGGK